MNDLLQDPFEPFPTKGHATPPAVLEELIKPTGVRFNGDQPWDIQVFDGAVYDRILSQGSLGFGESFMDGLWDCYAMDEMFHRVLKYDIDKALEGWNRLRLLSAILRQRLLNLQASHRAFQVGEQHYDIGNDIFEAMLDPSMSYSCGYWHGADSLEQAQYQKLDMICRKLQLSEGESLLDIGCGWGGLAQHAARHYGVQVTGITVSKEQQKLAQQRCADLPVRIELMDYRELSGKYDKIISVGMFEHVGRKNYTAYFDTADRLLKNQGLFLLHTIGRYTTTSTVDRWTDKYIFPNGKIPSAREITVALDDRFLIEDWHNFGQDYDLTLTAWWHNFDRAWPGLAHKYSQRFYRMWKYYLLSCAGFFRSRQGQLWQIVLSKRSRNQVYRSIR
jgi:cyclopropane-fatty-acyl-phospholipid synthase